MNNLRWLTSLFNGRNNRWMFGNRRNNRGMMLSLLGLGVGAATTYGMTRGRANRMTQTTEQLILNRFMRFNNQQIIVDQLNQAKANVTLTQNLLNQAIEKSSSDPTLAQEAIKQSATEIAQAQIAVSQAQSVFMAQKSE